MNGMYGKHFAALWQGADLDAVKATWARRLSDLTGEQIARGLMACERLKFPPTLPEFKTLCMNVDYEAAFHEAAKQQALRPEGRDKWPTSALYWAAQRFGPFDLLNLSYRQAEARWRSVLDDVLASDLPDIPENRLAIPAPGEQTVTREDAIERLGELRGAMARFGLGRPSVRWAENLMEREAAGDALPQAACEGWRDALGYALTMPAADALAAWRAKEGGAQ